ncbi:MAG: hypothetical protein ABIK38_07755 [candidate division WOR-3 bacterium]
MSSGIFNRGRGALCASAVLIALFAASALAGDTIWTRRYDSGLTDWCSEVALNSTGNVIILGEGRTSQESDTVWIKLICYDSAGEELWAVDYDSDAIYDMGFTIRIGPEDEIVVAGIYSYGPVGGGEVVKFDESGNLLWVRRPQVSGYDYTYLSGVAIDDSGYVYVSGYCGYSRYPPLPDALIIKYNPEGEEVWRRVYNLDGDFMEYPSHLLFDGDGNLIAVGTVGDDWETLDYLIMKFTPDGDTVWTRRVDVQPDDEPAGAVITGSSLFFGGWDWIDDRARPALANFNLETLRPVWTAIYYLTDDAFFYDVEADSAGNVIGIGHFDRGVEPTPALVMNCSAASGALRWTESYEFFNEFHTIAMAGVFPEAEVLYLTGVVLDTIGDNPDIFLAKLRYSAGIGISERMSRHRISLPVSPSLGGSVTVRLSVPASGSYDISVLGADGRSFVQQSRVWFDSGNQNFTLPSLPAGVYFLDLAGAGVQRRHRLVVVK